MIWLFVAAAGFAGLGGYLLGVKIEQRVWQSLFKEYLQVAPSASEVQRLLSLLARMERYVQHPTPADGDAQAPLMLEPDEARERTPRRLRESDNRTFWA